MPQLRCRTKYLKLYTYVHDEIYVCVQTNIISFNLSKKKLYHLNNCIKLFFKIKMFNWKGDSRYYTIITHLFYLLKKTRLAWESTRSWTCTKYIICLFECKSFSQLLFVFFFFYWEEILFSSFFRTQHINILYLS